MEKRIEFDKKSSFEEYNQIESPNYISIGIENEKYFLIYNEVDYQITENEVNELLKILSNINLQILPKFGMGCDGESYSLKLSNGWNFIEFNWWSDTCGKQWESLFLFRESITKLKDKCLLQRENFFKLEKEYFLTVFGEEELEKIEKLMDIDITKKQQNQGSGNKKKNSNK